MTPADLTEHMVPVACELACLVRDQDPGAIAEFLDRYTDPEDPQARATRALLVVLAAMMPVEDSSPADLLAWADGDAEPVHAAPEPADGTFTERRMAEYARHRGEGKCMRAAAAAVWVSGRTAERYEAALVAAGEASWERRGPGRAAA